MALSFQSLIATVPELKTQLDLILAAIPAAGIIAGVSFDVQVAGKRIQPKASVVLLLQSTGGSTLTSPWVANYFQAASSDELETKLAAFLASYTGFVSPPYVKYRINDNGDFDQLYALVITNADADAYNNFLPTGDVKP